MTDRVGLEELLAWYRDAGVDEALEASPVDRFAESAALVAVRREATPLPAPAVRLAEKAPPARTIAAISPETAALDASAVAQGCADLAALEAAIQAFEACGLKQHARSTVFAAGTPTSRVAVIGDVPDRDEDAEGVPFAGPAAAMLERMLGAIDVATEDIYRIAGSPWRTPGQRPLNPQEKAQLTPFLRRHVELAEASVILVMGGAAELLFGASKRLPALRGRLQTLELDDRRIEAVCTFHPNFLLRHPRQKRLAWADLLLLRERLGA